jgi:hypothetical protein
LLTKAKCLGGTWRSDAEFISFEERMTALLECTGYLAAICTTGAYVPQVLRSAAQARMRPPGVKGTFDCSCSDQSGSCTLVIFGSGVSCSKDTGDTCKGDCSMLITTPSIGGVGGVIAK